MNLSTIIQSLADRFLDKPRVIFDRDGKSPYLSRFYLLGRKPKLDSFGNPIHEEDTGGGESWKVFLHKFHRGDEDADPHNHPWAWSVSLVLAGGYLEWRLEDGVMRPRVLLPGNVNFIRANDYHRVELLKESGAWTLFVAGPKLQSWGFFDLNLGVHVPWRQYIDRRRAKPRTPGANVVVDLFSRVGLNLRPFDRAELETHEKGSR